MNTVVPLTQPATFADWWDLIPIELRTKRPLCELKWDKITGDGLDTKMLDKDAGVYVRLFLKATPEEIIEGTKIWRQRLKINADYSFHEDIRYERRASQFLNQGAWRDV